MMGKVPHEHPENQGKHSILGRILRFLGLWFAFTSIYSASAVCPFCGQPGCPVGAGTAGLVGGFFALLLQDWRGAFKFLYHGLFRKPVACSRSGSELSEAKEKLDII